MHGIFLSMQSLRAFASALQLLWLYMVVWFRGLMIYLSVPVEIPQLVICSETVVMYSQNIVDTKYFPWGGGGGGFHARVKESKTGEMI